MCKIDFSPLRLHLKGLSNEEKNKFASDCGTSLGYMRKRMSLNRPFGFFVARKIAEKGVMTPQQLRPNDYENYIWN